MPITPLRDTAIPAYSPIAGTISLPTMQGIQDAATWEHATGKIGCNLQGTRVNNRVHPVIGASYGQSFMLEDMSIAVPIEIPNGYNSYSLQANYKLNILFVTGSLQLKGATLSISLLIGSSEFPLFSDSWDNPALSANNGIGFVFQRGRLPLKVTGKPKSTTTAWLKINVDLTDNEPTFAGTLVTSVFPFGFYQGIANLDFHLFKDPNIVF